MKLFKIRMASLHRSNGFGTLYGEGKGVAVEIACGYSAVAIETILPMKMAFPEI
ncbi:hypothetical protein ACRQ1B_25600 [Rhizobium panacihumi]|uniref:hypothetical protein n=1 Tax=Rhizobium panacihumi TaxID=2008450 RepID=UPI003D78D7BF